jgi:hypothetical protein
MLSVLGRGRLHLAARLLGTRARKSGTAYLADMPHALHELHDVLLPASRELQDERRRVDAATADAIEAVLDQLDACAAAERDFSLIVGRSPPCRLSSNPHAVLGAGISMPVVGDTKAQGPKPGTAYGLVLQTTRQAAATLSRATPGTLR